MERVRGPESESLEFKTRLPPAAEIARHLAALANSAGGLFVVGVDERHGTIGVEDPERVARRIVYAAQTVSPSLHPTLWLHRIEDGRAAVIAEVKPIAGEGPYAPRSGAVVKRNERGETVPLSVDDFRTVYAKRVFAGAASQSPEPVLTAALNEQLATMQNHLDTLVEEATEAAEERARQAERFAELQEESRRAADERARQAEERAAAADERVRQADERVRQADERAEQANERAEQADERVQARGGRREARVRAEILKALTRRYSEDRRFRSRLFDMLVSGVIGAFLGVVATALLGSE